MPSFCEHNVHRSAQLNAASDKLEHETCIVCGVSVLASSDHVFHRSLRRAAPVDGIPLPWYHRTRNEGYGEVCTCR